MDYKPWELQKNQSFKPQNDYVKSDGPFDGHTTHNTDYTGKQTDPTKSFKPDHTVFQSIDPFTGITTNRVDYTQKQGEMSKSFKPQQTAFQSTDPFNSDTTHRSDFTQKAGEMSKSFRPDQTVFQSTDPFNSDTTHRSDFTQKQMEQLKSFKPSQTVLQSDQPLSKDTTHTVDYRAWSAHVSNYSNVSSFKFDLLDLFQKRDAFRPKSSRHLSDAPFQVYCIFTICIQHTIVVLHYVFIVKGNSDYTDNFKQFQMEQQKSYRPNEQYKPSSAKLDDQTTYRTGYVPKDGRSSELTMVLI